MIQVACRVSDNNAVLRDIVERAIVAHRVSIKGASPVDVARAFGHFAAWPGNAPATRERGAVQQREKALKARIFAGARALGIELLAGSGE
jgi:hypothetical protein